MKKVNKILILVIGIIIGTSITVCAYSYHAKDIEFTPTNESWEVDNVGDALNDLNNKVKDYKKLDVATTVNSNNLLNGITAYDNEGNLITGVVSVDNAIKDVISIPSNYASDTYDYNCGFKPSFVYLYWGNDYTWMHVNNKAYVFYTPQGVDYGQLNNGIILNDNGFSLNVKEYSSLAGMTATIYVYK